MPCDDIYDEIQEERRRQDEQWGGFDHDQSHSLEEWLSYMEKQIARLKAIGGVRVLTDEEAANWETIGPARDKECLDRLVKIAALATAAYQAYTHPNRGE